jgi:hypothetical protein
VKLIASKLFRQRTLVGCHAEPRLSNRTASCEHNESNIINWPSSNLTTIVRADTNDQSDLGRVGRELTSIAHNDYPPSPFAECDAIACADLVSGVRILLAAHTAMPPRSLAAPPARPQAFEHPGHSQLL